MRGGRYYIRYYDPARIPSQIERALRTKDRKAAQHLFSERRQAYLYGEHDPWTSRRQEGTTLSEAIEKYLEDPHIRPSTRRAKRYRLGPFDRAHPGMMASGVTEEALCEYCLRPELKRETKLQYLYEFRKLLDFCVAEGWCTSNPAADALKKMSRHSKRETRRAAEYLKPADVDRLLSAIDYDVEAHPKRRGRLVLRDVVLLAVSTGLRRGELCGLRWRDVDLFNPPKTSDGGLSYGWIAVRHDGDSMTKTGDEDRVPLVPISHSVLKRLHEETRGTDFGDHVFRGPRGGRLDGEWISSLFREYRKLAKLPDGFHFHSLRHTCASWLAESGTDLKAIQEVLRHSNIRQTLRYAHLMPEVVARKMVAGLSEISLAYRCQNG
jgi:integrase